MANIKISELPTATELNNNDYFPIVSEGETKKISGDKIKEKFAEDFVSKTAILGTKDDDATDEQVYSAKHINKEFGNVGVKIDNRIKKFYTSNLLEESVEDSDDGAIRNLKIWGKGFQQSYSGKNVLKTSISQTTLNGVTISTNPDFTLTLNGTATARAFFVLNDFLIEKHAYKLKAFLVSGNFSGRVHIDGLDSIWGSEKVGNVGGSEATLDTFNPYTHWRCIVENGTVCNNLVIGAMVADDVSTYEPYVGGIPSPNPSYPQPIHSVVNPKMTVFSNNLLKDTNFHYTITVTGEETAGFDRLASDYIENISEHYTYSRNDGKQFGFVGVAFYDKNKTFISREIKNFVIDGTVTPPSNAKFLRFFSQPTGDEAFNSFDDFKIMLEQGSTATSYRPYQGRKEATLLKTLNAIPVSSGGNVTIDGQQYIADYVDVEKKVIKRIVGKKQATSQNTEQNVYVRGNGCFDCNVWNDIFVQYQGFSTYADALCNRLPVKTPSSIANGTVGFGLGNGTTLFICLSSSIATKAQLHEYLDANEVWVYGKLATPTEETLTDAEVADFLAFRSYYGVTNATVTSDDLDGASEFLYPCSIENFVEYVKEQTGDTRQFIYDIDDIADQAFIDAQYALALIDLA